MCAVCRKVKVDKGRLYTCVVSTWKMMLNENLGPRERAQQAAAKKKRVTKEYGPAFPSVVFACVDAWSSTGGPVQVK